MIVQIRFRSMNYFNIDFFLILSKLPLNLKILNSMKKTFVFAFILAVFCLHGCNSKPESQNEAQGTDSVMESSGVTTMDTTQNINNGSVTAVVPTTDLAAPTIDPNNQGMNPAHGQPGHRCDIDVGAPLNSPPGKSAPAQPVQVNPTGSNPGSQPASSVPSITSPTQINPVAQPGKTLPGMNPAHGEPGHDCAIPVGSPLKK